MVFGCMLGLCSEARDSYEIVRKSSLVSLKQIKSISNSMGLFVVNGAVKNLHIACEIIKRLEANRFLECNQGFFW